MYAYSDSDLAGDPDTRRLITSVVCILSGAPVLWEAHRQKIMTLSTAEAEYVSACMAVKDWIWLRKLLSDIGRHCTDSTVFNVDNQSTIKLVKNPEFYKRTKHIDV